MSDKKYKELSRRLDNKKKSGPTFSSYYNRKSEPERMPNMAEASAEKQHKPKKTSSSSNRQSKEFLSRLIISFLPIMVIIVVLIFGVYALVRKNATAINVNNELVGELKTTKLTEEEFLKTLNAKLKELEHSDVQIFDKITLTPVHGSSKYIMDDSMLLNKLVETVNYKVKASQISVEGVVVGIVANEQETQSIFKAVMDKYITNPDTTTARFVENVETKNIFVAKDDIVSSEYVKVALEKTSTVNKEYEAVMGDTFSKIAAVHGMTMSALKDCNPDLDMEKTLKVGQKVMIVSNVPYVSVLTVETKTEIESISVPDDEQLDPTLNSGQTRILKQGKEGKKEVVSQITRVNGIITADSQVSEAIVEPAEAKVVAKGTK